MIKEIFHNRLLDAYHTYLTIGGMPECIASWIKYKDPEKVSQIKDGGITNIPLYLACGTKELL